MSNPKVFSVDTCLNCRHVFKWEEYDDAQTLYCTLNAPPRPKSGSLAMEERFDDELEGLDRFARRAQYSALKDTWYQWCQGRERSSNDKCEAHERRCKCGSGGCAKCTKTSTNSDSTTESMVSSSV